MRGLTLWQPWATLAARGSKLIETRSWSTRYRGPLLLTAATRRTPEGWDAVSRWIFLETLVRGQEGDLSPAAIYRGLPYGVALATCVLHDVQEITDGWRRDRRILADGRSWTLTQAELAFGDYTPGRCAWLLRDVRPLAPVAIRGGQRLWKLAPAHLEALAGARYGNGEPFDREVRACE